MNDQSILFGPSSDTDGRRAGGAARRLVPLLVAVLLAAVLAFVILIPTFHWQLRLDLLPFLLPSLLRLETGFLPLALVLALVLWMPMQAHALRGQSWAPSEDHEVEGGDPSSLTGTGTIPVGTGAPRAAGAREREPKPIELALGGVGDLSSEQRDQAALALGMERHRQHLHDQGAWARASARAIAEQARRVRGRA